MLASTAVKALRQQQAIDGIRSDMVRVIMEHMDDASELNQLHLAFPPAYKIYQNCGEDELAEILKAVLGRTLNPFALQMALQIRLLERGFNFGEYTWLPLVGDHTLSALDTKSLVSIYNLCIRYDWLIRSNVPSLIHIVRPADYRFPFGADSFDYSPAPTSVNYPSPTYFAQEIPRALIASCFAFEFALRMGALGTDDTDDTAPILRLVLGLPSEEQVREMHTLHQSILDSGIPNPQTEYYTYVSKITDLASLAWIFNNVHAEAVDNGGRLPVDLVHLPSLMMQLLPGALGRYLQAKQAEIMNKARQDPERLCLEMMKNYCLLQHKIQGIASAPPDEWFAV